MSPVPGFPAMKASDVKRMLARLGYHGVPNPGPGSHEWLECEGRPRIRWAFHKRELSGIEVRNILVKQAGLSVEEAREVVRGH